MAQYRILNPVIKTVEEGKQNKGKKYLVASLQNTRCIWEAPQKFVCFNENVVNAYTEVLSLTKGGIQQQDLPVPEELQTLTGCWIDYVPEQKFYKTHLSAHPAQPATPTSPAKPAIKVGDIVSKGGIPIVYTTLRVFCIYYTDEFGEKAYPRGESPQEVGQRAFNAYCIPINENGQPQTINDPAKIEPVETVQAAQTATVQAAPQSQQVTQQAAGQPATEQAPAF